MLPRVSPDSIHDLLSQQFKIYSAIGGMPEAVLNFSKTQSYKKCEALKQDLLVTFQMIFQNMHGIRILL